MLEEVFVPETVLLSENAPVKLPRQKSEVKEKETLG